jgi:hypothetical protein
VQKREQPENEEDEGQGPVDHDPARKPPQPHDYMLPRGGLVHSRERGGPTRHLMIQQ